MALGLVGFLILYALERKGKVKTAPSILALLSFCFAVSLGAVWEIFEFSSDNIFGTEMQKVGIADTMWDLILDSAGALIASLSGYFYLNKIRGLGVFEYYFDSVFKKDR